MPTVLVTSRMHHAQSRVPGTTLVVGVRVRFDEESLKRMDTAVDHHQDAATVVRRCRSD